MTVVLNIDDSWVLAFLLTLRSRNFSKIKTRNLKQQYITRCYRACKRKLSIKQIKWCMKNHMEIKGLQKCLPFFLTLN